MALTAHKILTMLMKYLHTEDDLVRSVAGAVNQRRQVLLGGQPATPTSIAMPELVMECAFRENRAVPSGTELGETADTLRRARFLDDAKLIRFAVDDLDARAKSCRRPTTASPQTPCTLPVDRI